MRSTRLAVLPGLPVLSFSASFSLQCLSDSITFVSSGNQLSSGFILSQIDYQNLFYEQARFCRVEVIPGPNRYVHWGVPSGTRDLLGRLLHDDLLISAALCASISDDYFGPAESAIIPAENPLDSMSF